MKKYLAKFSYMIISKKFLVFCVATWLVYNSKIDSIAWTTCGIAYMSIELAQKIFVKKDDL